MKPEDLYVADDITDMAEFPDISGNFTGLTSGRYQVFGDPLPDTAGSDQSSRSGPSGWQISWNSCQFIPQHTAQATSRGTRIGM